MSSLPIAQWLRAWVLMGTHAAAQTASIAAEQAVLADPAPSAFVDLIADWRILFNCFAHVQTPCAAYVARSAVFMALLGRFSDEGIDIGTVLQRLEMVAAPVRDEAADRRDGDAVRKG